MFFLKTAASKIKTLTFSIKSYFNFFYQRAALRVDQKLTLFADDAIQGQIGAFHSTFDTDFHMDFNFNSNFKTLPAKVCLKMALRAFSLRETNTLYTSSSNNNNSNNNNNNKNKLKLVSKNKIETPIQGRTFMFSREAVQFC